MSDITIKPIDGGLQLVNGAVSIQAINVMASLTNRYAELRVRWPDGSAIYLPQRIDLLNSQDVTQWLVNLAANDPGTNWDKLIAELGMAVAQLSDNSPDIQTIGETNVQSPLSAVLSHRELLELKIEERKSLLGCITEGSLSMVYADRGRGKTRFALGLSTAVAQGKPFLEWESGQAADILYIDGEMPLSGLRQIVEKMCSTPLDNMYILASEYFFHTYKRDLRLTEMHHRKLVDRILEQLSNVKLLIIDNISTLFPGISEDKKQDWEPINAWLIQLRHQGLAVLLVHHAGKTGNQRGTSAREDILDNVINLKAPPNYDPEEGCHFHLHFTKSRFAAGDAVKSLDVKCLEKDNQIVFEHQPVVEDYIQQVRDLLMAGIYRPTDIANELGISKGYASKLKKKAESNDSGGNQ
jgi:putative DNA primase/helicase